MASINLQSKNDGDDGSRSPARSRTVSVSSPWSKIVSGDTGEISPPVVSVAAPAVSPSPSSASESVQEKHVNASSDWCSPETSCCQGDSGTDCQPTEGSDNAVKKPVWSKPLNGVVEAVSSVMDADSWPALGESTKAATKSSSSESLQALSDGLLMSPSQVSGSASPSSHKLATVNNANPTSTPNHVAPSGQRSTKRGGGSTGAYISSNGGVSQRSSASHDSKVEASHNTSGKPGTVLMDSYSKDPTYKDSPRGGFGSQTNSGNNHQHQRNSYRRGNGSYHHNYGGKVDQGQGQGRGNQEWNHNRNFNNRDNSIQPQRGSRRGYVRPTVHNSAPFIHPPMRPFAHNIMYSDVAPGMIYMPGPVPPMVAPMPSPIYFPFVDPHHANIMKQIDYYFSNENLVRDTFLRGKMDEQGWVPVSLIAGFNKVSSLTKDIQLILGVMRASTLVEVQGDKLRRRNDWMRWLMPPPAQYSSASSPETVPRSFSQDSLMSQLQDVTLDKPISKNQVRVESSQQGGFERAAVA